MKMSQSKWTQDSGLMSLGNPDRWGGIEKVDSLSAKVVPYQVSCCTAGFGEPH